MWLDINPSDEEKPMQFDEDIEVIFQDSEVVMMKAKSADIDANYSELYSSDKSSRATDPIMSSLYDIVGRRSFLADKERSIASPEPDSETSQENRLVVYLPPSSQRNSLHSRISPRISPRRESPIREPRKAKRNFSHKNMSLVPFSPDRSLSGTRKMRRTPERFFTERERAMVVPRHLQRTNHRSTGSERRDPPPFSPLSPESLANHNAKAKAFHSHIDAPKSPKMDVTREDIEYNFQTPVSPLPTEFTPTSIRAPKRYLSHRDLPQFPSEDGTSTRRRMKSSRRKPEFFPTTTRSKDRLYATDVKVTDSLEEILIAIGQESTSLNTRFENVTTTTTSTRSKDRLYATDVKGTDSLEEILIAIGQESTSLNTRFKNIDEIFRSSMRKKQQQQQQQQQPSYSSSFGRSFRGKLSPQPEYQNGSNKAATRCSSSSRRTPAKHSDTFFDIRDHHSSYSTTRSSSKESFVRKQQSSKGARSQFSFEPRRAPRPEMKMNHPEVAVAAAKREEKKTPCDEKRVDVDTSAYDEEEREDCPVEKSTELAYSPSDDTLNHQLEMMGTISKFMGRQAFTLEQCAY